MGGVTSEQGRAIALGIDEKTMLLPPKNVAFSPCFSSLTVSGVNYYLIRLSAWGSQDSVPGGVRIS